jgi:primosomal protein N' (replication factor Y) (superfamily II helicase)
MADEWGEGRAGVLLWDTPPLIHIDPPKEAKAPREGKRRKRKEERTLRPAADKPVARIAVDMPQAHLDRPFDYLVPEKLADQAQPGVRVRIRFVGALIDGFLIERVDESGYPGNLRYLERVLSTEQVLTDEIAGLARAVADRYAGTLADVLRLAIPQRHAATEAETRPVSEPDRLPRPDPGPWTRYPAGPPFLNAIAAGRPARAAWTALPGPAWPEEIARAATTAASAGQGVVIVVPHARDLARVDEALAALIPPANPLKPKAPPYVTLTADLGPAERYRRWLAALRGETLIVAGTRAAMFAPVKNLGLVVLWDDGDDLHADPRAPYPHAREVLALRAHRSGAAALIGGFARTTEMTQLVRSGWAAPLRPDRQTLRRIAPRVMPAADEANLDRDGAAMTARLPTLALQAARQALETGPVLVQVPRRGYLAAIACARCRTPARCTRQLGEAQAQLREAQSREAQSREAQSQEAQCNGPLRLAGPDATPDCRWCGALATESGGWHCPCCGHDRLRAVVTGAARTAEELGRAFPGVKIRSSGGDLVLPRVPGQPALVIATPGAEPVADYAAALLLDGWALLSLPSLRAGEETLRRWLAAAALVRPGGTVLVHADATLAATQALVRWDPVTFAERDLAERAELGFPPAVRMAAVTGEPAAVASVLRGIDPVFEILGPVPPDQPQAPQSQTDSEVRALIRASRADGALLAKALQAAQAGRSARGEARARGQGSGGVRVQLDPPDLI